MLTRLLLLGSLLLGVVTPPQVGHAEHCAGAGGTAMSMPMHDGHDMPSPSSAPADRSHRHCPPVSCLMTLHCASAFASVASPAALPPALRSSHFAPRTAVHATGR